MGRLVAWQSWQRLVRRPLTVRLVGGLRMKCYPHSKAAALVIYCRLPEWQHMNFVRDFLRPGDCFVDVGANVGSYSLLAAATPGLTVVAFEPSSLAYGRLVENVELNGLGHRFQVHQIAIGAEAGEAKISVGQDAINHLLRPGEVTDYEVVPMEPLDAAIPADLAPRVRLLKVDVEGFEDQVLQGGLALLASQGPVVIVEGNDVASLRAVLEPLGYRSYSYDPDRHRIDTIDWLDVRDNNLLAIRDRSSVASCLATASDPVTPGYSDLVEPNSVAPLDSVSPTGTASLGRAEAGMGRRISWMVVDQGLSSLSNVATSIVAARALSPRDFGAFGLAFVIYSLVLGLTRGAITEPLVSLYSHEPPATLRGTLRSAAGSAVDLGVVMGIAVAVVAAVVGRITWVALGGLAVVLPGLMLQDAWRYCFVASGRPRAAVFNDSLWCLIQAGTLVVLLETGRFTLLSVVLWWGLSGTASGLVGCIQAGMTPKLGSATAWVRRHRELSWRYATEYGIATGTGQVALVLLGAIAGLAALGAIRGALVFFGPIVVLYTGAFLAIAAEGVRLRTQPVKLRRLMEYSSLVLVAVAALSLLTGIVLPDHLGRAFFGATWIPAQRVIVPIGLAVLANCAAAGAVIGLRALAAAKASLRARVITAPMTVVGPLVGAAWGARGFAIGLAIASWAGAAVWWRQFVGALAVEDFPERVTAPDGT